MRIITLLFLVLPCMTALANTPIVKCRVSNTDWVGLISLDAVGAGLLKFKRKGTTKTFSCPLAIEFIEDGTRNVVSGITIDFRRGECDPEDQDATSEVFKEITLILNTHNKKKPEGRLQWLKKLQPDNCKIEKFRALEVRLNAKKWQKGKWGRSTASKIKSKRKTPHK